MKIKCSELLNALVGSLIFLAGCSGTEIDPKVKNLNLILMVLDNNGNERHSFDSEEDITQALKAINTTEDTLELGAFYDFCPLPNANKDFFLIYEITKSNELIAIGRPFQLPIHCIDLYSPVFIPPYGEMYISKARWLDNPGNSSLKHGNYYSSFEIEIEVKIFNPEVRFTIQ